MGVNSYSGTGIACSYTGRLSPTVLKSSSYVGGGSGCGCGWGAAAFFSCSRFFDICRFNSCNDFGFALAAGGDGGGEGIAFADEVAGDGGGEGIAFADEVAGDGVDLYDGGGVFCGNEKNDWEGDGGE